MDATYYYCAYGESLSKAAQNVNHIEVFHEFIYYALHFLKNI